MLGLIESLRCSYYNTLSHHLSDKCDALTYYHEVGINVFAVLSLATSESLPKCCVRSLVDLVSLSSTLVVDGARLLLAFAFDRLQPIVGALRFRRDLVILDGGIHVILFAQPTGHFGDAQCSHDLLQ